MTSAGPRPSLYPMRKVQITAGKYAGRTGHVIRNWTHRSGVPFVDVNIRGEPGRDAVPREFSGMLTIPPFYFVVSVRKERTCDVG